MFGVDFIAGLYTTAAGFDMIQNRVDLLSCEAHAVPTRSTATAADAAAIIRDMCLRSGDGFPDVLVVHHDSKFTSDVVSAFIKGVGSSLVVGSEYHKDTNAKAERANGVISDALRAYADCRKNDRGSHLPLAVIVIHNAASGLSSTAERIPGSRCRRRVKTARRTRRRRTTRSGCGRWRRTTGCCCGPRSCSTPPTYVSCARGGTAPSL